MILFMQKWLKMTHFWPKNSQTILNHNLSTISNVIALYLSTIANVIALYLSTIADLIALLKAPYLFRKEIGSWVSLISLS